MCGLLAGPARAPDRQAPLSPPAAISSPAPLRPNSGFGKFPLQFIPNKGQTDRAVAYYIEGRDKTVYFTAAGLTFVFTNAGRDPSIVSSAPRWAVKLDFVHPRKGARPVGLEKSGATVSYFRGRPETWKTGLAPYSKLVYRDLWPGIDLVYSGTFDRLKYEFVVRPGADPSRIMLACRGAEAVELTADGRLAIRTPAGGFEDDAPIAYQEIDGARRLVSVAYDLEGDLYGFAVGDYDRARTLLIDPSSLVYCGFIGGQGAEEGLGIALDNEGSAYVVGVTTSSEMTFPMTSGPDLTFNGGSEDAFIAKVGPDGTGLVYCGYIGGSGADCALKVAVDALGSAYVAGYTDSKESTFPVVTGPDLTQNVDLDAFVAKVDPTGTDLVFCGYIGGEFLDMAMGIAVDGLGNAYVSGATASNQATFPVKVGPDLTFNGPTFGPKYDAFVAKVDSTGTELTYCGYIGGYYDDISQGIAVDGLGNAYVSGTTASSETDGFPLVGGPTLTFQGGGLDAFVAKVNAAGTGFDFCGYLQGHITDLDAGIALDLLGNVYVAKNSFVELGPSDATVIKLSPSGAYVYFRTIGGIGDDMATGIAVDVWGNAYLVGTTNSNNVTFPVTVGPGLINKCYGDSHDVFVAKIPPSGSGPLIYCGYIGGQSDDQAAAIAVDGSENAYIVGTTTDGDWAFFPVIVGPGLTYNGGDSDAFVVKVPPFPAVSNPTLTSVQPTSALAGETPLTITLDGSDFVPGAFARWNGGGRPTTFVSDTRLTSDAYPSHLWEGREWQIYVENPDGQRTGPVSLTIYNPVPALDSLSPDTLPAGGDRWRFRLQGSNFLRCSIIHWNGTVLSGGWDGSYISSSELETGIPSADLASGGEFQVTVENLEPGGGISAPRVIRIATFQLSTSAASATVDAGRSATYTLLLTPQYGSFDATVKFTCEGLPEGCSPSFSPASTIPGGAPRYVVLTLRTSSSSASLAAIAARLTGHFLSAFGLLLVAAAVFCRPRRSSSSPRSGYGRWLTAGGLALLLLFMATCAAGGSGGAGVPQGTYAFTVKGTAGNLSIALPLTLIVR